MVLLGLLLALSVVSVVAGYVPAAVDAGSTHLRLIGKSAQGTHVSRQGPLHPATTGRGGSQSLTKRALQPWEEALPRIAEVDGLDQATRENWRQHDSLLSALRSETSLNVRLRKLTATMRRRLQGEIDAHFSKCVLGPIRDIHNDMAKYKNEQLPISGLSGSTRVETCLDWYSLLSGDQAMTPNLSREAEEELQMMVDKAYAECRQRSRLDRTDPETHPIKTREQCEELSRVQVKDKEYLPDKGVWFEKVDLASVAGAVGNQFKRHMFGSPPGGKQAPKGVTAPFGARPMMVGGFGR